MNSIFSWSGNELGNPTGTDASRWPRRWNQCLHSICMECRYVSLSAHLYKTTNHKKVTLKNIQTRDYAIHVLDPMYLVVWKKKNSFPFFPLRRYLLIFLVSFCFFGLYQGGAEYQDFLLDPLDGSVSLNRSLEDNELVQPVILVVKVLSPFELEISTIFFFDFDNENKLTI